MNEEIDLNALFNLLIVCSLFGFAIGEVRKLNDMTYVYDKNKVGYGEYLSEGATLDYVSLIEDIQTSMQSNNYDYSYDNGKLIISFVLSDNQELKLPLLYYKGYSCLVNGKEVNVYKSSDGLISINIENTRSGEVVIYYKGTFVQKISRAISAISLCFLVSFVCRDLRKERIGKINI